jgi:SAM-dependent methyltransferase
MPASTAAGDGHAIHALQDPQEREYAFPYHYIAGGPGAFRHFVHDSWAWNYASTMEHLSERIRALAPRQIIDIGCGDGRFSRELALAIPQATVLGIDYSRRAIALARAMNPDLPALSFAELDITRDAVGELGDVAVLMEVFEHIPPERCPDFLAAVARLVRPGGVLLMTVPHANKPVEYKHFRHFTCADLARELAPYFEMTLVMPFERRPRWHERLLISLAQNRWFLLCHDRLLRIIYGYYRRKLFPCPDEACCQRILVCATPRRQTGQ